MVSKRILSLILTLLMLISCATVAGFTLSASAEETDPAIVNITPDERPSADVEDMDAGLILQAWNWSYKEVEKNLEAIKEAGFTTIQISPPTELKEGTVGVKVLQEANDNGWWMMYQPAAYELNQSEDNVLGTKDDLVSMIDKAHEMGLYVIADAVINHLGNNETADYKISSTKLPADANAVDYLCERAWNFDSSKKIIDAGAFHFPYANCKYNDTGAFDCTQNAVSLLPDLDTSSPVVQEIILDYWQECIDAGIDGFRIDAAKHIETKYDGEYASDFWDVLMYDGINGKLGIYPYAREKYGKDLFMYGEILNTVSTERSFSWYLEYMNITNSTAFYAICDAVNGGTAANAVPETFNNGMTADTAILWDESHDTYMDGCKANNVPSVTLLTKRWACMAARADVVSMYLARPTNTPKDVYNLDLGAAYDTAWNDKETAEINKFHNHFIGADETVSSYGNIAIIERGDSGVVLVNCRGTSGSLTVPVKAIKDGTYIDQMTGNTFTVANGNIEGTIGKSGVAVIYNPETPVVGAKVEDGTKFTTDTIEVEIFANGTEATYSVNGEEAVTFTGKKTLDIAPVEAAPDVAVIGMLGDVDGNESVNVRDATLIQKASAGLETLTEDQKKLANVTGDTNANGDVVNVRDATAIQKFVAGLNSGCEGIGEMLGGAALGGAEATLTLTYGDVVKTYTYTQISEDEATWVMYDNSDTNWTHVYCYVFDEDGNQNNQWPGILMEQREDNIWYYEIPEGLEGATVIFNNNLLGTGEQSSDLPMSNDAGELHSDHFIFIDGKWNAILEDGTLKEVKQKRSELYIVFTDVYGWKSNKVWKVRCCTSTMSAPGEEMTYLGQDENGHDQYYIYVDRGATSLRFYVTNKKTILKETANCVVDGDCGYYPLAEAGGPQCGTFDVTPVEE